VGWVIAVRMRARQHCQYGKYDAGNILYVKSMFGDGYIEVWICEYMGI